MSTVVANDLELIQHLDFNFEEPCDLAAQCDVAAVWKIFMNCCDNPYFFCDSHYAALLRVMDTGKRLRHGPCKAEGISVSRAERIKS